MNPGKGGEERAYRIGEQKLSTAGNCCDSSWAKFYACLLIMDENQHYYFYFSKYFLLLFKIIPTVTVIIR